MIKLKVKNFQLVIIVVLISCFFFGCKDDKKSLIVSQIKYNHKYNINLITDSNVYVDFYDENNKPFKYVNYKLNKEGKLLRNGEYIEFYPNSNIKTKGKYNNDLRQGNWYYYSEEGNLNKIEMYVIDSNYHFAELLNHSILFDSNQNIDLQKSTSFHRINVYQDTIYNTELFLFTVSLPNPKFKDGMNILIGDYDECYKLKPNSKIDTIKTNTFEKTISIKNHKIGLNTIRGIILNYDSTNLKIWPYFFSVNYYVEKVK